MRCDAGEAWSTQHAKQVSIIIMKLLQDEHRSSVSFFFGNNLNETLPDI
jgi:hypothetical protein